MRSLPAICWYLSGLFLLGLLMTSVMSVAPGAERFQRGMMVVAGGCGLLFAALAAVLRNAESTGSRGLLRVLQGVAIVTTLFVLLVSVG